MAEDWSLYIVRCRDDTLYTGIAIDVAQRLAEHAGGPRGAKYLRGRGPLRLAYARAVGSRSAASRAEYRVKRLSRDEKEALIAGRMTLGDVVGSDDDGAQVSGAASG